MIIGQLQRFTLLLTILFVVVCVFTTTTLSNPNLNPDPTSNKQGAGGLILNLIHRELIYPSPKYEYDPSIAPPATTAGLGSNISKGKNINRKQIGDLLAQGPTFFVDFYIGTPGVRQFASFDTGSTYIWVQCAGYRNGYTTNNAVYNPRASTSYIRSYCRDAEAEPYCRIISRNRCDERKRCGYNIEYMDGSHSRGHVGFETISFSAQGSRNITARVTNVLFGCGMDNNTTNRVEDGIFGIGGLLQLSIVGRQTQKRFSFCIGSIYDILDSTNHVALGNDALLEGVHVPYQLVRGTGYGVRLDGIYIGGKSIRLPHNLIVQIDSAATYSQFPRDVYDAIKAQVERIIGQKMDKKNSTWFPNRLCYEDTHIWRGFPNVSIVSGVKTILYLDIEGMFWRFKEENTICLAIDPRDDDPYWIGGVAMQFHNVGFDLNSNNAYFNRKSSCYRPRITT